MGRKKTFILNFHLIYCINHLILPKNDEVHVAQKGQTPLRPTFSETTFELFHCAKIQLLFELGKIL